MSNTINSEVDKYIPRPQDLELVTALAEAVPDVTILLRGSPGYEENIKGWNLYTHYYPTVVVQPRNTAEVAKIIQVVNRLDWSQVAIRAGGHSLEGSSLGGKHTQALVIDVVLLEDITSDSDKHELTAGGGALLGHVYQHAFDNGKQWIPMGSCVGVGLAGQVQCGGYGHYTRYGGTLIDHALEFEIVTPDGEVRIVNESSEPDLWFALRGAGTGSFGIITKVKLRTLDSPGGCAYFNFKWKMETSDIAKVFKAIQSATFASDVGLSPMIVFWQGEVEVVGTILAESSEDVDKIYNTYRDALPKQDSSVLTHESILETVVTLGLDQTSAPWYNNLNEVKREGDEHIRTMKIKAGFVPKPFTDDFIEEFSAFIKHQDMAGTRVQILGLDPNKIPKPDTTSVKNRGCPWLMGMSVWTPAEEFGGLQGSVDAAKARLPWLQQAYDLFYPYTTGGYIGDDDIDENILCRDAYLSYWGKDYLTRLVAIKNKYDPKNRFHHELSIPLSLDPKLVPDDQV